MNEPLSFEDAARAAVQDAQQERLREVDQRLGRMESALQDALARLPGMVRQLAEARQLLRKDQS